MDANFFEPLDSYTPKVDSSYAGCVQIQNLSGMMLQVVDGHYLRNYAFAIVSKKNEKLDGFVKNRKVKIHEMTISKASKKKKVVEQDAPKPEEVSQIGQTIDIDELAAMFTMEPGKFEKKESIENPDAI